MPKIKLCFVLEYAAVFIFSLLVIDFSGVIEHFLELDFNSKFHYHMHDNVLHYAHLLRFSNEVNIRPINSYNYTFISNPVRKCFKSISPGDTVVIVLVKSARNHFERRNIIRKTWGSEYTKANEVVRIIFLLGNSRDTTLNKVLESESNQYQDIVMADFLDSYYNNTIKTMIGFRWAVQYCPNSSHYLFVDDDYYVSMKNVFRYIMNRSTYTDFSHLENFENALPPIETHISMIPIKLYAGFMLNSSPHRHKSSKWYISLSEYPFDMWPPYITAGAYILSKEALFEMYYVSMFTKNFRFDDIYLSILALKAEINITHCPEFYFQEKDYTQPQNYQNVIASHGYGDPSKLLKTWSECFSAGYA